MGINYDRPLLGFIAWSGSGKTTLLEKLIPELRQRGLRVGLIKHAHHDFDIDIPGKDSYRLRKAGASQVMVASAKRWALINEHETGRDEPVLNELLQHLDPSKFDLVLVEGFKHEDIPRIEVWRQAVGKPLIYTAAEDIIAIACDEPPPERELKIPLLDINRIDAIADFISAWLDEQTNRHTTR